MVEISQTISQTSNAPDSNKALVHPPRISQSNGNRFELTGLPQLSGRFDSKLSRHVEPFDCILCLGGESSISSHRPSRGDSTCSWNLLSLRAEATFCFEPDATASSFERCTAVLDLGSAAYGLGAACCVSRVNCGRESRGEVSSYGVVFATPMRDLRKESAIGVADGRACRGVWFCWLAAACSGIVAGGEGEKSKPLRRHCSMDGLGAG